MLPSAGPPRWLVHFATTGRGRRSRPPPDPHRLWRRHTDQEIHRRIGKMPLEVGADRIARAAAVALQMLREAREQSGLSIPVPTDPSPWSVTVAIEVYPAATRRSWQIPASPVEALAALDPLLLRIPKEAEAAALRSEHSFDAVLALLAAADAALGRARAPDVAERPNAAVEGWIWARDPRP